MYCPARKRCGGRIPPDELANPISDRRIAGHSVNNRRAPALLDYCSRESLVCGIEALSLVEYVV